MRTLSLLLIVAAVFFPSVSIRAAEDGFTSLFDGQTLNNWDGNPKFWKVEEGTITGETTSENPTKGNTFIIYRGGELSDFELKFEYKIIGGNSGVQYRSFEVEPEKNEWVVGGYQGDFEAGKTYSGILYGERFRGILANRGQKTELVRNGDKFEVKVVGSVGDSSEIQSKIKSEDWNDYSISAKGFHFVHKINGVVTAECTDNDEVARRASGILALQLHAGPPMKVQFRNIRIKHLVDSNENNGEQEDSNAENLNAENSKADNSNAESPARKKIAFIAGRPSHGYGSHEHYAGCMLLAKSLEEAIPNIETIVFRNGWPEGGAYALSDADTVVVYCDGGGGHLLNPHIEEFAPLMKKGTGLVCLHYGVETVAGKTGDAFLDWMGGYFETNWSVNPHWDAEFTSFPDHPITRGVEPFKINDEWYFHMRFREEMKGVTPILSAHPPEDTMRRPDGAHSGNPAVRKAIANHEIQHVAWASENDGGGRGFGFTGGHFHWNWGDENFRKVVLNGILWTAHGEVPSQGVSTKNPSQVSLEENQDEPKPANFRSPVKEKASSKKTDRTIRNAGVSADPKPIFKSSLVTTKTPGHAIDIDVEINGATELYLVVTDGGDGHGFDWANWAEPRLVGPNGEKKLTEINWKNASCDWGKVHVGKNAGGNEMKIAGEPVAYGIGTHARSIIAYDIPNGFTRFKARGGIDNGGSDQEGTPQLEFVVYTAEPTLFAKSKGGDGGGSHEVAEALDGLDVGPELAASLFAAEPQLLSPSNIDIDHRGRVWACEIVNYRKHKSSRPEGDRILILEDTDSDGLADKVTVFYQGNDIDSPHGVCVLGEKVIVSAGDKVLVFTDSNGDDKPDQKEVLFSGIDGSQHDHGIHAFTFGPDGKLYFNFGNAGKRIKDKNGNPIIDTVGNEVNDSRRPYQEGMVFRCNLDGSELETLGWNFRNNWMVTVDSYGGIWQSDNDDDGNKGVRINYVMEYGNYGYKDEKTGAGWKEPRTGMSDLVPEQHWHLNDPGVVPNLLLTGAGSPTGITVYEGDLLPMFRGELLHCDAGPNVCRAYMVQDEGAGYKAEMREILTGTRDKWFRPSDVKVAPDGSLIIADWYDPGVGGHGMGDLDRGRLFRITPADHGGEYVVPKFDFSTASGAIEGLKNANYAARYMAWQSLHKMGKSAESELVKLSQSDNPIYRARATWLLGNIDGRATQTVREAIKDKDANIRTTGIRLARQMNVEINEYIVPLLQDPSPQVRRELLVALRHSDSPRKPELWAELATQYDGKDRWYLEALGLSSDTNPVACFDAWLEKSGDGWNTKSGRDIVWRVRAPKAVSYLVRILQDESVDEKTQAKFMRAFDFHEGKEKETALKSLLGL